MTTIAVEENEARQLRRLKISCKVKDLNEVIKMLIKFYRNYKNEFE